MKKAIFTLMRRPRWLPMRQLALVFLLTWGFLGLRCVQAQITTTYSTKGDTTSLHILDSCQGSATSTSTMFTDDNTNDGNYADTRNRRDTIEICPKSTGNYIKVVIKEFDLDLGDTLFVFDGNLTAYRSGLAPVIGTGTSVGVSNGFGGWVDASCNPKANPSGCLTFLFKTDGDNKKGSGWEAWVDCAERDIILGDVSIASKVLTIDSAAYGHITIPAPEVKACGVLLPTMSDSVRLVVRNQLGDVIIDTILTHNGIRNSIWDNFAIGIYSAEYTLLVDPTQQLIVPFSVQGPALVCNDNVIVPLGSACVMQLMPDDILESPADTIPDTMYYNLTITLGTGKNKIVKTTTNYDNDGRVIYPSITATDVRNAGMSICDAEATVTIERIYYQLGGVGTIPNNGVQNASCQTKITFTDHSAPFISINQGIDTLIACDTTGLMDLLNPRGIDNCDDDVPVSITVEMDETDPCYKSKGDKDITKAIITFTAMDDCGNIGRATRAVTILRPDENKHIVKTDDLNLDCTDTMQMGSMPGLQIGGLRNGEFIVKDTIPLSPDEYICGYILIHKDVEIPNTECGRKIYRYWSVADWCSPEIGPSAIDTQLIKYTDTKAPTFVEGAGTMQMVSVGAFECTYDITTLPKPIATDNCAEPIVRLDSVFRIEDGLPWAVPKSLHHQLDLDSFYLRWIAEDECHEQLVNDTVMQLVIIKEVTRPTAVCTDQLNISVGSNATIIGIDDIDAGSYDACGIIKREISRDGINFGPTVTFTCEDINDTVQVTYRIMDAHGNTNSCWLGVHPEDKIRPICTPFSNGISYANGENIGNTNEVHINCNESKVAAISNRDQPTAEELAAIGGPLPAPLDNCINAINVELEPIVIQSGFCGLSVYQRRWIAKDAQGRESVDTCTQTISVDYVADWSISFPEDVSLLCPVTATMADSVILKNGTCDRLAMNIEQVMYDIVEDACFQVVKTYHIINWCNYKPGDEPTHAYSADNLPEDNELTEEDIPNLSYITYTQIIKVDDNEGPVVTVGEDTTNIITQCLIGDHDGKAETVGDSISCGELRTFEATAEDCVTDIGGQLNYVYKLYRGTESEVILQTAPVVHRSSFTAAGNKARMTAFVMPGTYTAEFVFFDNCGNSSLSRKEYTFKECKRPTPYLLNGIAVELGQTTKSVEVWANDFDQGSYDNCTIQDSLRIRIWHISLGINPPTTVQGVLDSLPSAITFNCNYLGNQVVQIYVVDESDNFDFAATFLLVQDNMRTCQTTTNEEMIAGEILTFQGESIENVAVSVNGQSEATMMTEADGHYQFMLAANGDYTITPEKNDQPLNGVSTFDLVLISKHILGIAQFDSPYKQIAADVNKSGTITAFDMVQLRQLILSVRPDFPNNQSWRFVDKNYSFTSAAPVSESFPESVSVNNLTESLMQTDFVGVKVGDVNGNALTNSLLGVESRNAAGTFQLQIADQLVQANEIVEVQVNTAQLAAIEGYQFTMDFEGLSLLEVEEGVAKAINFNTDFTNQSSLTTSWNGANRIDNQLFTLRFQAKTSDYLRNLISISSDYTPAEAYNLDGEILAIAIDFQEAADPIVFQLEQNTPNPFKNLTTIAFSMPEAGWATLTVMDIQGKILKTIKDTYKKGYHQISLDASTIGATGVLHYQLETDNYLANKKMIIIE